MPLSQRLLRSAVSYVPSAGLLGLRELRDVPLKVRRRPHEADFELLAHLGLRGARVLDVGANRGQSIRSLRLVLSSPSIRAFEPNPFLAAHLRRRFDADSLVEVHAVALGQERGELQLYMPRYGHTVYDTRASLDREVAEEFLASDNFTRFDPRRAGVEVAHVEVRALDEFGLDVDVVKFDVEGVAQPAILGGLDTIRRSSPLILIEDPPRATHESLAALGYRDHAYEARGHRLVVGSPAGLNTVFARPEHLHRLRAGGVRVEDAPVNR